MSNYKTPQHCEKGHLSIRDLKAECVQGIVDNERWSISMGCPTSQVNEFRKRFPNSVYSDDGRLLVKNRKDKIRQGNERGMVEYDKVGKN